MMFAAAYDNGRRFGHHCYRLASPISIKHVYVGIFIISSYEGFFRGGKYFLFPQN